MRWFMAPSLSPGRKSAARAGAGGAARGVGVTPGGARDGRTAMPVLRSRGARRAAAAACGRVLRLQRLRQPAYGDVAVDLAPALAAQPADPQHRHAP